jgi:AAA+ ATPase superfamily predicted ATPase
MVPGPRSCGKSKLIKSVLETRKKAVVFDCRGGDTTSPSAFLEKLIEALAKDAPPDKMKDMMSRMGSSIRAALQSQLKVTLKIGSAADPSIDLLQVLKSFINAPSNTPKTLNNVYEAVE